MIHVNNDRYKKSLVNMAYVVLEGIEDQYVTTKIDDDIVEALTLAIEIEDKYDIELYERTIEVLELANMSTAELRESENEFKVNNLYA